MGSGNVTVGDAGGWWGLIVSAMDRKVELVAICGGCRYIKKMGVDVLIKTPLTQGIPTFT